MAIELFFTRDRIYPPGQSGQHVIGRLQDLGIEWRSNFSPELKRTLGVMMRGLNALTEEVDGQPSFLANTLVATFDGLLRDEMTQGAEFPIVVFEAVMRAVDTTVHTEDPHINRKTQEALILMLANAGAEGIGALSNMTGSYLSVAYHNRLHPDSPMEYYSVEDMAFEKGHRQLKGGRRWREEGFISDEAFDEALQSGDPDELFLMRCLGELFVRKSEVQIRKAAETIVRSEGFDAIARSHPHVLKPTTSRDIFLDKYDFLGAISGYVSELATKLGIASAIFK